jgi:LmbE family N-acetylglucosaminyl deacetylase
MLPLGFRPPAGEPLRLLCLGAHSDDIEIGCAGAILRLIAETADLRVQWCVFSATGARIDEARRAAADLLQGAGEAEIAIHGFRDGLFPAELAELKSRFEALKAFRPSLILTHCRGDLHQDHRTVSEMTHNTFRDHLVLEYEIPKYDPDLGNPNLFVPIEAEIAERKIALLMTHFGSQRSRGWFSADTFRAMLRLRGIGCQSPSGFAEAFYCRKAVLGL